MDVRIFSFSRDPLPLFGFNCQGESKASTRALGLFGIPEGFPLFHQNFYPVKIYKLKPAIAMHHNSTGVK
jgi:hypothetical protein